MMMDRDPAKLSSGTLESMLKDGNASQVAEIMLDTGQIFPAFLELLVHEKMFVRLGAMVVVEELADRNPALASQVIDPLWERFPDVGDQVKGDIIHVLGEAGDDSLVPRLEAVLSGSYNKEVKEAAKEALGRIKAP
jgi:HEAT repeat protein